MKFDEIGIDVVITGAIALILVSTICIIEVYGHTPSPFLSGLVGTVIGYYFRQVQTLPASAANNRIRRENTAALHKVAETLENTAATVVDTSPKGGN